MKVMSLIKWLFLVSELHTNYAKMASAADFRSPSSSDQRRFGRLPVTIHAVVTKQQATRANNTAHCCDKRTLTRQTDSDFQYRCSLFPLRENTRLDMHIQTHSAAAVTIDVRRLRLPVSSSVRSSLSSAPRYFPEASQTFSLLDSVTKQLRRYYSSQLRHISQDDRQIKVPLSLSRSSKHSYSFLYYFPTSNF